MQEEAEALRQALVETPDYRLAQIAMDRLEGLEGALWNIQASEARAAVTLSKQELEVHNITFCDRIVGKVRQEKTTVRITITGITFGGILFR